LPVVQSPILPLIVGGESAATELAGRLREAGIFIPAVRYPTVARGSARHRMTLSAEHTLDDLARVTSAFRDARAVSVRNENAEPSLTGESWRWCPRCGHELHNEKCKFRCPRCHYFMSCSDFD
jgi:hypothetical protein